MKKHPVDDLFKRKLTDFQKKPSVSAWARIQKRQQPKRGVISWTRYAAASVLIGVLGGYLITRINPLMIEKPISRQAVSEASQPTNALRQDTIMQVATAEPQIAERAGDKSSQKILASKPVRETLPVEPDINNNAVTGSEQDLAQSEIVKPSVNQSKVPAILEVPEPVNIKSLSPEISAPVVASLQAEPTRTIVVTVESETDNDEEQPRASKFSKVFRQLKNARAGERVDWDEVGFNPKTLVAKVDDRLRNKEEKAEKYQNPKTKF